jgi:MFS family permease
MSHGWANIAKAYSHRNFRNYQISRFFAHTARWMYKIAIGWMVWKLTGSISWLGFFALLDQAPAILVMPLAGALTDRIDPVRMLRLTQLLLVVEGVALALLDYLGLVTLPVLIVFAVLHGIVTAFQLPANQSVLPHLMPRDALTVAYGLNSVTYNIARFIGPMLAGVTIAAWGTAPAIFANAVGAAIFMFGLYALQRNLVLPAKAERSRSRNMLGDIRDGFSYATKHLGIGPAIVILMLLALLPFSVEMILPSLADGVYGMGATGLSYMTAALGLGAMLQASLIARRGGVAGLSFYGIQAVLAMGVAFSALAFSRNFWVALGCIFVIGFTASAIRVSWMTLLQYCVDPQMRGRVASIYGMITHICPAVGAMIVGAIGDRIGLPVVMGAIGIFHARRLALGVLAPGSPDAGT